MQTINVKLVEEKQPGGQEVSAFVENIPDASDPTPADGSITAAKLADGAVETAKVKDGAITAQKLASGVIPEKYTLPAATKEAIGGVKQAAFVADPAGEAPTKAEFIALRDALVTAKVMAAS